MSEIPPPWNWLAHRFKSDQLIWKPCSSYLTETSGSRFAHPSARVRAALSAGRLIRRHAGRTVVISHGPLLATYTECLARPGSREALHLVFSFNFTNLPKGIRRVLLRRYLARVDRFVVASSIERTLYSEYFGLEASRLDLLLWGVQPPLEELRKPARFGDGCYVCAIGSQARDYQTLIEAMRRLPAVRLILVASADSLPRTRIPSNVHVMTNVPLADAMNVLAHSRFMVLPLRDSEVPCGHVTAVSAMHMGKAILCTDTTGLRDYLTDGSNAVLFRAKDSIQLAEKIELLFAQPELCRQLGDSASAFARCHCSEDSTVAYFRRYLEGKGVSV